MDEILEKHSHSHGTLSMTLVDGQFTRLNFPADFLFILYRACKLELVLPRHCFSTFRKLLPALFYVCKVQINGKVPGPKRPWRKIKKRNKKRRLWRSSTKGCSEVKRLRITKRRVLRCSTLHWHSQATRQQASLQSETQREHELRTLQRGPDSPVHPGDRRLGVLCRASLCWQGPQISRSHGRQVSWQLWTQSKTCPLFFARYLVDESVCDPASLSFPKTWLSGNCTESWSYDDTI